MTIIQRAFDWLTAKDYIVAKDRAAVETAARYSRGNIAVQNGWFIDEAGLSKLSLCGDESMRRLKARFNKK